MLNNVNTSVERIIAKIDNDFNPDGSDWIPRVIAWTIDAMSQLDVLRYVPKRRKLNVTNRIARSYCPLSDRELKVYDSNGCEIKRLTGGSKGCSCTSPTGGRPSGQGYYNKPTDRDNPDCVVYPPCDCGASDRVSVVDTGYTGKETYGSVAIHTNSDVPAYKHIVHEETYSTPRKGSEDRNYVLICGDTIELNYDANCIEIESLEVETEYSDYYKCDVPVIPNNGILIEAIGFYCMYKMLCRGMKHPVFNLNASQYGTNPYYQWMQLKDKARAGVIVDMQKQTGNDDSNAWRSYFYNYTFPKR